MGALVIADRLDENCALSVTLSPASATVTTPRVAIRDGNAPQVPPSYLDFADSTFKTAGWATRQAALDPLGGNVFALDGGLDVAAITNLPTSTDQLVAEYELTVSGEAFLDSDLIQLTRGDSQCHLGVTSTGTDLHMEAWMERNGEVVINPSRLTIDWFLEDGTLLFSETIQDPPDPPDAQGHYLIVRAQPLVAGQSYYARLTMQDNAGILITDRAIPFNSA